MRLNRRQSYPMARRARARPAIAAFVIACFLTGCADSGSLKALRGANTSENDPSRNWTVPTSVPAGQTLGGTITQIPVKGAAVSIFAGSGLRGGIDGPRREAQFDGPMALALDHEGYLLVAEYDSGRIRIIDDQGFVRSWVGQPRDAGLDSPSSGPLDHPTDLVESDDGERIYVLDGLNRLLAIQNRARLLHLAGSTAGFADGPATQAAFRQPLCLAQGPGGALYISDSGNHRVRIYDPSGLVYTMAGSGTSGYGDGPAPTAQMAAPHALAVGPNGQVYIGDGGGWSVTESELQACIRTLDANGELITLAGGKEQGYVDGAALSARLRRPLAGMDVDSWGNVYFCDTSNHAVRVLTPGGMVMTVAGTGAYGLREGHGSESMLGLPMDVLWDGKAGLWVADYGLQLIWRIDLSETELVSG